MKTIFQIIIGLTIVVFGALAVAADSASTPIPGDHDGSQDMSAPDSTTNAQFCPKCKEAAASAKLNDNTKDVDQITNLVPKSQDPRKDGAVGEGA